MNDNTIQFLPLQMPLERNPAPSEKKIPYISEKIFKMGGFAVPVKGAEPTATVHRDKIPTVTAAPIAHPVPPPSIPPLPKSQKEIEKELRIACTEGKFRRVEDLFEEIFSNNLVSFATQFVRVVPAELLGKTFYLLYKKHPPQEFSRFLEEVFEVLKQDFSLPQFVVKIVIAVYLAKNNVSLKEAEGVIKEKVIPALAKFNEFLAKNSFERVQMDSFQQISLVVYFETVLPKIQGIETVVLKMGQTGLSRTIQYDPKERMIYLLANHTVSKLYGEGSFKKVVSAAGFPLGRYENIADYARVFTKVISSPRHYKDVKREIQIANELGFIKMRAFCAYPYKPVTEKKHITQRISVICERTQGDLRPIAAGKEQLSHDDLISIIKDIVTQLATMHDLGYLHGDLKPDNILHQGNRAMIADYGFTRNLKQGETPSRRLRSGFHQSLRWTAPELYAVKNFTGDYFKAEVFAAGVILYQIYHQKQPPWMKLIKFDAVKSDVRAMQQAVIKEIKPQLEALTAKRKTGNKTGKKLQQDNLSTTEKLQLVICSMLISNPRDRPSANEIKALITELQL